MGLMQRLFGRAPARPVARAPAVRRYAAARPDRLAGGFTSFGGMASTAIELRDDLRGLVAHSRKLAQNDDYMKAFLRACRRNIIGPDGIALEAESRDTNGTLDTRANAMIEDAWKKWGKVGKATVCGRYSWQDVQSIAAMTTPRDGNFLLRLYRGPQYGPFAFQLQLVDIDQLAIEKRELRLSGGGYIDAGIEYNELDRPVAYHIWKIHPSITGRGPRECVRVPAEEIIHLFTPEEPGQSLGVPWAHTALRRLNMMGGYEEAALTAARVGAAKMGFYTRQFNDDIDPDEARRQMDANEPEVTEAAPGEFETLPAGYAFTSFDPKYPDGEMDPFMKLMLRGAAAGMGVAYHTLANDLTGANFSSLHHGVSEERAEWRALQRGFAEHLHDLVFAAWLPMALLTRQIQLPMEKLEKYSAASWKPRGWKAVNPLDEANATTRELAAGLRSPQSVMAERGQDLDETYEQIAEAKKLAEQYGLSFDLASNGRPAAAAPATSADQTSPAEQPVT